MAFVGFSQIATEQINVPAAVQGEMSLGSIGADRRGNLYAWSQNGGTALSAGQVTVAQAKPSNSTGLVLDASSPLAVGSRSLVVDANGTAFTQGQFTGGYLLVTAGTGAGTCLLISNNTAAPSTTGAFTVYFLDQLFTALDSTSRVSLVYNPWGGVIVNPGSSAAFSCTGVPETAVPANYYYWSKVRGIAATLSDGSPASKGAQIIISPGTVGAITIDLAASVTQVLGWAPEAQTSAQYLASYMSIV